MDSKILVTFEVDDPMVAAEELEQKLKESGELKKNSIGLLFCYSDMDVAVLAKEIYRRVQLPIIGGTAIASMDRDEGFHEMSVMLTILTADDCDFSLAVSEPIRPENIREQAAVTYRTAAASLDGEPKLAVAIPPYQLDIMLDAYTDVFTEVAPSVPFVGGLPSYNGNGDTNMTVYNGEVYPDRLVLLTISGNLKPVFSLQTVLESQEIKKRRVTHAEDNVIYKVDNLKFTDYLTEIGMPLESISDINKTVSFVANPLLVEDTREGFGKDFKYLRSLHDVDLDVGSATAIGRVPQGGYISIHPLNRNEIGKAALLGIRKLKEKMEEVSKDGYQFSTVLGVSCIGRYVIMTPNSGVEVENLLKEFPQELNLTGFYSYGEISPLEIPGGIMNFSHNESLVLCAF